MPSNANTRSSLDPRHSFCFSKPEILKQLGAATDSVTHTHTPPQELKSVCFSTQPGVAPKVVLANSSMSATEKGVKGSTRLGSAPPNTSPLKEYNYAL